MARHHAPSRLATLLARPPTFWAILSAALLLLASALGVLVAWKGGSPPSTTALP